MVLLVITAHERTKVKNNICALGNSGGHMDFMSKENSWLVSRSLDIGSSWFNRPGQKTRDTPFQQFSDKNQANVCLKLPRTSWKIRFNIS